MKLRRFKVEQLDDALVRVQGGQAHHAVHVLRLKTGDRVTVFDGMGVEADGCIAEIQPDHFTVRIEQRRTCPQRSRPQLCLAVAVPKGERADWMIEKCAELGVTQIIALRCARSQVLPGAGKINRWRRKADEAAKQSGQSVAMQIEPVQDFHDAVIEASRRGPVYFGDPRAAAPTWLSELQHLTEQAALPGEVTLFIGPEGGFTEDEIRQFESLGARPARWAGSVLRIETAAVAAASVWAAWAAEQTEP